MEEQQLQETVAPSPTDATEREVPSADFTIDPTKLKLEDKKLGQGSFGVVCEK